MASGDNLPSGELSNGDQARAVFDNIHSIISASQDPYSYLGLDFAVPEVPLGLRQYFPPVYLAGDKTAPKRPDLSFKTYSTLEDYQSAPRPDLQPDCIYTGDPDQAGNVFNKVFLATVGDSEVDAHVSHRQVAWLRVEQTHADPNLPVVLSRSVTFELWQNVNGPMFIHHPEVDDESRIDMGPSAQLEHNLKEREWVTRFISKAMTEELLDDLEHTSEPGSEPKSKNEPHVDPIFDLIFGERNLDKDIQDAKEWLKLMLEDRVDGLGLVTATEANALELLTKKIASS